jgi:hypothetical protein
MDKSFYDEKGNIDHHVTIIKGPNNSKKHIAFETAIYLPVKYTIFKTNFI